jgi:CheY-like chemotaxis protein
MSEKKIFCLCCDEDVTFNKVNRDGNLELICANCGFVLDVRKPAESTPGEGSLSGAGPAGKPPAAKFRREAPAETDLPVEKAKGKPARRHAEEKEKPNPEDKLHEEERKKRSQVEKELQARREALDKEEKQRRVALEKEEKERREQLEKEVREQRARLEREEKELRERIEREAREERERIRKEERERIKAGCVLVADGSPVIREFFKEFLIKENLAHEVLAAENGAEFMIAYSNRVSARKPLNLVILDLQMPIMDGLTTAHAMRSMEKKFGVSKPIPILFFSAKKSDDELRSEMKDLHPALYLNKGDTEDPAMVERIDQLVARLLENPTWPKN